MSEMTTIQVDTRTHDRPGGEIAVETETETETETATRAQCGIANGSIVTKTARVTVAIVPQAEAKVLHHRDAESTSDGDAIQGPTRLEAPQHATSATEETVIHPEAVKTAGVSASTPLLAKTRYHRLNSIQLS